MKAAFLIGLSSGSIPDSLSTLTVSDCTLTAPTILALAENFGNVRLRNVAFTPSKSQAVWNVPSIASAHSRGRLPLKGAGWSVGSSLMFENCQIVRDRDIEVAAIILENPSTMIGVTFDGFGLQGTGVFSLIPELLLMGSGAIGQLTLTSLNSALPSR
jgi:hypothetical protein